MHEQYLKELSGLETCYTANGFFLYMIKDKVFDVSGFYIKPEFRNGYHAKKTFEDIKRVAKEYNCSRITGSVVLYFKNPEVIMYEILRAKFKYSHTTNEIIYFYLDI